MTEHEAKTYDDPTLGPWPERLPGQAVLPDLAQLDLRELREFDHPVLAEVLAELRERAEEPAEMLWNFNSAM